MPHTFENLTWRKLTGDPEQVVYRNAEKTPLLMESRAIFTLMPDFASKNAGSLKF